MEKTRGEDEHIALWFHRSTISSSVFILIKFRVDVNNICMINFRDKAIFLSSANIHMSFLHALAAKCTSGEEIIETSFNIVCAFVFYQEISFLSKAGNCSQVYVIKFLPARLLTTYKRAFMTLISDVIKILTSTLSDAMMSIINGSKISITMQSRWNIKCKNACYRNTKAFSFKMKIDIKNSFLSDDVSCYSQWKETLKYIFRMNKRRKHFYYHLLFTLKQQEKIKKKLPFHLSFWVSGMVSKNNRKEMYK